MDKKSKYEFLKRIELFSDLSTEELTLISDNMDVEEFDSGKHIFQEASPRNKLFVILDGEVELYKTTSFGEERRLSFFSKDDFLGEGSLMDDSPHSTSARALLKTTTLSLSKEKYNEITKDQWAIAIKILSRVSKVISRRMRHTNSRVISVGAQYNLEEQEWSTIFWANVKFHKKDFTVFRQCAQ